MDAHNNHKISSKYFFFFKRFKFFFKLPLLEKESQKP